MGERDPLVDPREGDVLRWTVDSEVIVAVVIRCTPTFTTVAHVDGDGDTWIEDYAADRWSDVALLPRQRGHHRPSRPCGDLVAAALRDAGALVAQLTADAPDWDEWAAARIDGQPEPPPSPLPSPWVAHPTEARISASWDCYSAEVVADPERVGWTDAWRWSVCVLGVETDHGVEDWIDLASAAAIEALPPGVADD